MALDHVRDYFYFEPTDIDQLLGLSHPVHHTLLCSGICFTGRHSSFFVEQKIGDSIKISGDESMDYEGNPTAVDCFLQQIKNWYSDMEKVHFSNMSTPKNWLKLQLKNK